MLWRDVVDLLQISSNGAETARQVMANKKSVRQSEFYQAPADGLRPDIMFEVWKIEYEDEMVFRFNGDLYYVIRTYSKDDEFLELVAGRMNLPHTVTLIRKDPDQSDRLGRHPTIEEIERACRIDEAGKVVKNQQGAEVVSATQFTFPGWYRVNYVDELRWTDAFGKVVKKSPLSIEIIRDKQGTAQFLAVSC